ncbi:PucR family transcriptional regulator [Streptomyces sp. NPDC088354]|uniref:PucR family transcriptional regulator n=1 Tax=unclassified Streptomyces TaxID=2593676 RepID=UPI0029A4BA37|nr:helix-turn-helix domain-containing protein [Streptomyces sp. MI02-7b]MDX3076317.1 helix-turn-helix domain-containing protein [Streptomyces sp. MI02-7b]
MTAPAPTRPIAAADGYEHADLLRAAAREVRKRVVPLADRIVDRIRERHPAYREPGLVPPGFREEAGGAVAAVLDSLADPGRSTVSAEYQSWVGERRAWQDFPLRSMIGAYRTGGDELWLSLVRAGEDRGPDGTKLMARAAAEVWDLFERDSRLMADAYGRARAEATHHRQRGRRALEALLAGRVGPQDVAETARALDLPETGRFAVAVVRNTSRRPRPGPARSGTPAGVRVRRTFPLGGEVLLAELGDLPIGDFARSLGVPDGARAGLSPQVARLADAGHARDLAELALRTCTRDGEVALLDRRWPAALLARRPEVAAEVASGVLGGLRAVDPGERTLLLETLETWLDSGGSVERAAAALFCHANTLRRRLHRLEQLTGRSPSRPHDVVHLALALDAERIAPVSGGQAR